MLRVPRRPLDPRFVQAYRASDLGLRVLASAAGFAHHSQLSRLLNEDRLAVRASVLNIERLTTLAAVLSYTGPIFAGVRRG